MLQIKSHLTIVDLRSLNTSLSHHTHRWQLNFFFIIIFLLLMNEIFCIYSERFYNIRLSHIRRNATECCVLLAQLILIKLNLLNEK